jgi:hypothetical protein
MTLHDSKPRGADAQLRLAITFSIFDGIAATHGEFASAQELGSHVIPLLSPDRQTLIAKRQVPVVALLFAVLGAVIPIRALRIEGRRVSRPLL